MKPSRNFLCNVLDEPTREEKILRNSALFDICKASPLQLQQLEKVLLLMQIDQQQATVIRDSNLFPRLLDLFQSSETETRCLILRCMSEAIESMHRNEVFEVVELVTTVHLGCWCVEQLNIAMCGDHIMFLTLFNFAAEIVKVSKLERDFVVADFILPQFCTIMAYPKIVLSAIGNATLHDCHSRHMLSLLEAVLSIFMTNASTMLQARSNYELLLDIVNNYLFDDPANIQTCIQLGFHDLVWGVISDRGYMTESEVEFLTPVAEHIHPVSLLYKFLHLTDMIKRDATNSSGPLALILIGTQRAFTKGDIHPEVQKRWLKLFRDGVLEAMAKIPSMAFSEKVALTDVMGWLL